MLRTFRPLLFTAVAALAGCAAEPPAEPARGVDPVALKAETVTAAREVGDCADVRAPGCTRIELAYPVFAAEPDAPVVAALNRIVEGLLLEPWYGEAQPEDTGALMMRFIDDYLDVLREFPDYRHGWWDERAVSVLHVDDAVVSLVRIHEAYTGGAHSTASRRYVTVERQSGELLTVAGTFPDTALPALSALLEAALRRARELPGDVPLEALGFFPDSDPLPVPDTFAVSRDKVTFHYDAYEIGPYAMGPTTLELDRSAVAVLACPASVLGR
jgi:hypothetical protein